MRNQAHNPRRWICAWVLVLAWMTAVAVQNMPVRICVGDCPAAATVASCCSAPAKTASCCGSACCEPSAEATPVDPDLGGLADAQASCCITTCLELELAPVDDRSEPIDPPIATPALSVDALPPRAGRTVHRRAIRGPPRVDPRRALLSCVVLLI